MAKIYVVAVALGYLAGKRQVGSKFWIDEEQFSDKWMKKIEPDVAAAQEEGAPVEVDPAAVEAAEVADKKIGEQSIFANINNAAV